MMHPDVFSNPVVFTDVKLVDVKVDVGNQFTNEQEFIVYHYLFQWIHTETPKLGFSVIGRSDNNSDKRLAFVTLICERSGNYIIPIQKLKRDDNSLRKCECSFKLSE